MVGDDNGEPPVEELCVGEAVAASRTSVIGRRARSKVRVRVVGGSSVAWGEAAQAWGAEVEAVVATKPWHSIISLTLARVCPITVEAGVLLPPFQSCWDGIMTASVHDAEEAGVAIRLFDRWLPAVAIFAYPPSLSCREVPAMSPTLRSNLYKYKVMRFPHTDVGGVTASAWQIRHYNRLRDCQSRPPIMKMKFYSRTLQTALDDTLGNGVYHSFEPRKGPELTVGVVGGVSTRPRVWARISRS